MNETAILWVLGVLVGALFSLIGALYAVFNGKQKALETSQAGQGERIGKAESAIAVIQTQNARQERDVVSLQAQNTQQESALAGLVQRMIAREDAHAQHREDMAGNFQRLETQIAGLGTKIDTLIRGGRTPMPQRYELPPGGERK